MKNIVIFIQLSVIVFLVGTFYKYIPLEIALNKVKIEKYTENHKCLEFSHDLKNELENKGIQSEIEIGHTPELDKQGLRHAWVGIWIEPQTGQFTTNYYK